MKYIIEDNSTMMSGDVMDTVARVIYKYKKECDITQAASFSISDRVAYEGLSLNVTIELDANEGGYLIKLDKVAE